MSDAARINHSGDYRYYLLAICIELSPVIREEDWLVLKNNYEGLFLSKQRFWAVKSTYIELNKVYRQQDEQFVRLLNKIRNNTIGRR